MQECMIQEQLKEKIKNASMGRNYLLNAGPDGNGNVPSNSVLILKQMERGWPKREKASLKRLRLPPLNIAENQTVNLCRLLFSCHLPSAFSKRIGCKQGIFLKYPAKICCGFKTGMLNDFSKRIISG